MPHLFPIRVYYEDTDMAGIVYHANYLKYIERARSDWVREMGMDQVAMREQGLVWVVRRIEADYIASARFDDELTIETEVAQVTGVRLVMNQVVKRAGERIFEAVVTAVMATTQGQPVRMPANIRRLVN